MKKVQSFFILIVFTCFSFSQVFFSEYAEGSSNNKYLEIYNGTGSSINLDEVVILGNYNGNPWSGYGDIGQGTGETGSYQGNVTEGGEVGSDATGQQQYQNFPTGQMTNVGEPFDPYTNIGTVIVVEAEPPRTFMWDNENNVYVEYAEGGGQLGQTAPNQ